VLIECCHRGDSGGLLEAAITHKYVATDPQARRVQDICHFAVRVIRMTRRAS